MSTSQSPLQYCFFPSSIDLEALNTEMLNLMQARKAPNTLKAYAHEWKVFQRWCHEHGCRSLPADPKTVALFVTWEHSSGYSIETIRVGLAAIAHYHAESAYSTPVTDTVRDVVAGIARQQARTNDPNKRPGKDALEVPVLFKICRVLRDDDRQDVRDRAIILGGFASAWRRSELSALNFEGVTIGEGFATLRLGRSKSDQEGKGRETLIRAGTRPYTCPVRALEAWIKVRGTQPGPFFVKFRGDRTMTMERLGGGGICGALKRALKRVGKPPESYGAHSLRSGMITAADARKVSLKDIMEHTAHKRVETVMRYIKPRHADPLAGVL